MPADSQAALELLDTGLIGRRVWGCQVGHGSFLTLDIGDRRISSVGEEMGQFRLWIYGAGWTIEDSGIKIGSSHSSRRIMLSAARRLVDQNVTLISIRPDLLDIDLYFSDDCILRVTGARDEEIEDWMIFFNDSTVLVAHSTLSIEDSSTSR